MVLTELKHAGALPEIKHAVALVHYSLTGTSLDRFALMNVVCACACACACTACPCSRGAARHKDMQNTRTHAHTRTNTHTRYRMSLLKELARLGTMPSFADQKRGEWKPAVFSPAKKKKEFCGSYCMHVFMYVSYVCEYTYIYKLLISPKWSNP